MFVSLVASSSPKVSSTSLSHFSCRARPCYNPGLRTRCQERTMPGHKPSMGHQPTPKECFKSRSWPCFSIRGFPKLARLMTNHQSLIINAPSPPSRLSRRVVRKDRGFRPNSVVSPFPTLISPSCPSWSSLLLWRIQSAETVQKWCSFVPIATVLIGVHLWFFLKAPAHAQP